MKKNLFLMSAAVILAVGANAQLDIVLPSKEGGFKHRGITTDAQIFTINTPTVNRYNEYDSIDGLRPGSPRIEVPLALPQFDGSLGNLIAINLTWNASLETEILVEANIILDGTSFHEAGFSSVDSLFGGTAGYPAAGLLQRPSNDPRGIAPGFYPLGSIYVDCLGFPGDGDACIESASFSDVASRTVDVFLFEDENGPIYTLSDWIGDGVVPNFSLFVDNPGIGVVDDQFEFYVDNVDNAFGYIDTNAFAGTLTLEYVYELDQPDGDGDGVFDAQDNCTAHANPNQVDTNSDGFGNACDPDLNNDGIVNTGDLGLFRAAFFSTGVTDSDFNADGVTNTVDLGVLRAFFFAAPGPSGITP